MTTPGLSTIPAAITALHAHMVTAAGQLAALNPGVYVGQIPSTVANNFFSIGEPTGAGQLFDNSSEVVDSFQGPQSSATRRENYSILCLLRAWDPNVDPLQRLADVFEMQRALTVLVAADRTAGGALNGGYWAVGEVANLAAGRIGNQGWGVVNQLRIDVTNAFIRG